MNYEVTIQAQFEERLHSRFPDLEPINKWNQKMWQQNGSLVVSLVFLSKKLKFCFFNIPDLELDKLQRWSSTIYSQNLVVDHGEDINWNRMEKMIADTIRSHANRKIGS